MGEQASLLQSNNHLTSTNTSCSPMLFTDAKLSAYAANELNQSDAGALEVMMSAEPALARRAVLALVERRLSEPGGERLTVDDSGAAAVRQARSQSALSFAIGDWRPALPMAAGLAIAFLCAGISYLAGQASNPASPIGIGGIESSAMQAALERVPTGGVETLRDGAFRAVGSFITGTGSLCRQFSLASGSVTRQAVACRRRSNDWEVTFPLVEPSDDGTDYTPADGTDSISAYLQSLGASRPLTGSVEQDLLRGNR
jgi:hypothetical protein